MGLGLHLELFASVLSNLYSEVYISTQLNQINCFLFLVLTFSLGVDSSITVKIFFRNFNS